MSGAKRILAIDIGGTNVKMLATGHTEPRKAPSGKSFTPAKLVHTVRALSKGWGFDAVSIGFPGPTGHLGPKCEPGNLGGGWVGFDFAAAFEKPVKIANDAAMQALGSYEGGRMFFLGLGTGVGAALIADKVILPVELSHMPWRGTKTKLGDVLGRRGLKRFGDREWRKVVEVTTTCLMSTFLVDYVVVGGGNAKRLKALPHGVRLGHNLTAFRGGFRLWGVEDVPVLEADSPEPKAPPADAFEWRLM